MSKPLHLDEVDRSVFVKYLLSNSGEDDKKSLVQVLEEEDQYIEALSDSFRRKMLIQFQNLGNLNQPIALNNVEPICKLKLLTHLWLVSELQAKRINDQGQETDDVPEDWYLFTVNASSIEYVRSNRNYIVSFSDFKNKSWSVSILETATNVIETAGVSSLPGDCSDNRAKEDEKIIARIITANLVKWIRAFIIRIETSKHFTPKSPYSSRSGPGDN